MTVAKGFFYLAASLLAAVLLGGLYLLYKNTQIPTGADMVQRFQQGTLAKVPPTSCSYKTSDFDGTDDGILRIAEGNIFLKVVTVKANLGGQLIVRILNDGTYHVDPATSIVMLQGNDPKEIINSYVTTKSWDCSPWWSPEKNLFNLPQ